MNHNSHIQMHLARIKTLIIVALKRIFSRSGDSVPIHSSKTILSVFFSSRRWNNRAQRLAFRLWYPMLATFSYFHDTRMTCDMHTDLCSTDPKIIISLSPVRTMCPHCELVFNSNNIARRCLFERFGEILSFVSHPTNHSKAVRV